MLLNICDNLICR